MARGPAAEGRPLVDASMNEAERLEAFEARIRRGEKIDPDDLAARSQ